MKHRFLDEQSSITKHINVNLLSVCEMSIRRSHLMI